MPIFLSVRRSLMDNIYFDNAATSWPKPLSVIAAISDFNLNIGSNPGRSGHKKSIEAGRILFDTRELLADFFSVPDPLRIVYTYNVTHSLNIAIRGILKPGDHVITSSMEHNSVMRPLRYLEDNGVEVTVLSNTKEGFLHPELVTKAIRSNTRMIVISHASNVTGTVMPVAEIGRIAAAHGIIYCVDAAQSAGVLDINAPEMNIDLLCFTGHKSLLGPMGTGGIYIRKGLEKEIDPLMSGGTGSRSEHETQPDFMPDKFESGTLNVIGIAGLAAGVSFINDTGISVIRRREEELTGMFLDGIKGVEGLNLYGSSDNTGRTSVVAFNYDNINSSEASLFFEDDYGILSRPGLHCAPAAHKTIGSFPGGTNRFSFSFFNTEIEIEKGIEAVRRLAKK
jgi:cysteine desulfurase/selenocysteine lyase